MNMRKRKELRKMQIAIDGELYPVLEQIAAEERRQPGPQASVIIEKVLRERLQQHTPNHAT